MQNTNSYSKNGILQSLHYQMGRTQAKLMGVCSGSVIDVAVNFRHSSKTYGKWIGVKLSA